MSIFTDTSTEGWGSYLEGQETSGTWNNQEKTLHINIVELRAVRLATTHFSVHLAVKQQLLTTDNMTPGCLNVPADKLSQIHKTTNRMVTTPSCTREPLATMEETHDRPFCNKRKQTIIICEKKMKKKKKSLYVSPVPDEYAFTRDAVTIRWNNLYVYAYPPGGLISKVIDKLKSSNWNMILIAPLWPEKHWHPDLLPLLTEPQFNFLSVWGLIY